MPIPIFLKAFYVPVPLTNTRSINKRWKTLNHKQNKKNRLRKRKRQEKGMKLIQKMGKMHKYKKGHCDNKKIS